MSFSFSLKESDLQAFDTVIKLLHWTLHAKLECLDLDESFASNTVSL